MKTSKRTSLLAYAISFELLVGPIIPHVYAVDSTTETPTKHKNEQNKGPGAAEYVNFGLQAAGQIFNQMRGQNSMTPQMTNDMNLFQQQMTPQPDKYFSAQKLSMIPGLGQYLALNNLNPQMLNCSTLPTTMHEFKPEVCRIGVTGDKGNPQVQMDQAFTYYNQYLQTYKVYDNFSASSNSDGQPFGIGCMENAMNILNGFFKYRMNELDKLVTNLEALNNQFKEASRADLDAIKETVAVLEGGESLLTSELRSKRPDLFDFQKRFNNPACTSMFAGEEFNKMGRSKGLNSIETILKEKMNTPSGKYSGASYAKSHVAVVEDIKSVANKMSKQFEINFTSAVAGGDKGYFDLMNGLNKTVSSSTGVAGSITADTFSDLQTSFMESNKKLNEAKADLMAAHTGSGRVLGFIGNTSAGNFEAEVAKLENSMKNECLTQSVSVDTMLSKIYDPSSSKFANEHASNFLKDKLVQILDNDQTSIERKVAELKAIEEQQGNRYIIRMNNAYEVQELDANGNLVSRVVEASNRKTPSSYLSDVVKNCSAQFKANKFKGGNLTGAEVIAKLRNVNQDFKRLAQQQAQGVKSEVAKKLIECSSPEIANNSVVGSCTPELFNTSSPGFCANAAFSCSKNMQACSQQAEKFTKEIKAQKTARTNNYKALLEKNKNDIVKMFDATLSQYMKDGETLRGVFGAGFASPAGIRRQIDDNDNQKYLQDVFAATKTGADGALLLENPDAYVQMFKENIDLLKKSVEQQQNQILGGESVGESSGLLAKHIEQTRKNYSNVAKQAKASADECLGKHDQQIAAMEQQRSKANEEAAKMESELGEKLPFICSKFGTGNTNSNPNCNGDIDELAKAAMRAATRSYNRAQDERLISQWSNYCSMAMNHKDGGPGLSAPKGGWDAFCKKTKVEESLSGLHGTFECGVIRANEPHCKSITTTQVGNNGQPIMAQQCTSLKEAREELSRLYSDQIASDMTLPNGDINLSTPSFCNAGYDGNRQGGKMIMQGIQQAIQGGFFAGQQ